ncbi:LysR family transcriptional regulator [Oceanobacter kriegii]|uniref:LysR family transcriptional regulator n=1 Tax=Oceanobacter kriegii TaxID=64972 RepID=UPI0004262363|nr:LysR family transcriptional regulator [Oceanobacter kriegii]
MEKGFNIRHLQVFSAVVRHQSYSGAQQELNLTTSAISNYISELESRTGFVLCQRGRGGFALTEKGQQFLQQTRRTLDELEELERQTEALKDDMGGTFRMAILDATSSEPALSMPSVIAQFRQQFPAVHLNLQIRSPYEQVHAILNNQLDFAIGNYPTTVNNVITDPLYREQHWLFCSSQHPLYQQSHIQREDIMNAGIVTRSYWNAADLKKRGFLYSTATVESMEAQLMLILSGQYIGYLPEHYVNQWAHSNQLRCLLPSEFGYQAEFSMLYRRGRSREPFIRSMRELLQKQTAAQMK